MGANAELLNAAYHTHVVYMKPAFPPPDEEEMKRIQDARKAIINESNWKEHLGDERYYQAYVAFFSRVLLSRANGISSVLEDYVFSKDANVVPASNGSRPMMLSRFLAGFLHPLIHAGYGSEFGLPGLIAEGIAEATAQRTEADPLFPAELFETSPGGLTSRFSAFMLSSVPAAKEIHALTVLARVAKDDTFAPSNVKLPVPSGEDENSVDRVVRIGGQKLVEYTGAWMKSVTPDKDVLRKKFEEVVWMNAIAYGVGGYAGRNQGEDENKEFNGDFFYMHLVTSSLMTISLLNTLSPASASLLLRTYFIFSLVLYVARGRPPLPIADFYAATTTAPSPPSSPTLKPADETLPPSETPNPWLPILQTTLVHPNEHLCKAQRALYHYAETLGGTPAGHFTGIVKGLDGAEKLDGSLFVRIAGLTANRLGWMREGQTKRTWDNGGFFETTEKERVQAVQGMYYGA